MTGTPMQNRISDLHSLIKFLRVPHISENKLWLDSVLKPYLKGKPKNLKIILRVLLLRRTKAQHLARELPSITHETVLIPMHPAAGEIYEALYTEFVRRCGKYRERGMYDRVFYLKALRDLRLGSNHPLQFDPPFVPEKEGIPYRVTTPMQEAVNRRIEEFSDPNEEGVDHIPFSTSADWVLSTKLQVLIGYLRERRSDVGPTRKSVIFSQWSSTIRW